jgi:hypothetical protein
MSMIYSGTVITSGHNDTIDGSNWEINWNQVTSRRLVSLKLVHIPTGATIYDGKIPVGGSIRNIKCDSQYLQ